MRIIYFDIDSLRADHLGCYGYARNTSPQIDALAARGIRFTDVYVSDSPCLPSRTALFGGRFGARSGLVGHAGTAADLPLEGAKRGFSSSAARGCWMQQLRKLGYYTAMVSSFVERHSALHVYSGFNEIHNPGLRGLETADAISQRACDWLKVRGRQENWFLHVNFWDPHTPYRTPDSFGERFANDPLPAWLSEEQRLVHWTHGYGPHSARDTIGFSDAPPAGIPWPYPKHPLKIDSPAAVRAMFDGYDTGVRYADHHIGLILEAAREAGIDEDLVLIVSADHGENLGELNVYADHHTADYATTRVPLVVVWPGITDGYAGHADDSLLYQLDLAPTVVELAGGEVPGHWDGASFAAALRRDTDTQGGRDHLVLSHGAWTCQRAVRWRQNKRELLWIHTLHDGYHDFPNEMLFDVGQDPHEQVDLTQQEPELARAGTELLARWEKEQIGEDDPLQTVIAEGGPAHTRGELPGYLARLRATGREECAQRLQRRHAVDISGD